MSATPAAARAQGPRDARSWWQQLSAVMIKEAKQVTRDPSSWIIAVVLPLTFLFLFGYGISLDTTVVKIAVVRENEGRDAQDLAAALSNSKWFLVVPADKRGTSLTGLSVKVRAAGAGALRAFIWSKDSNYRGETLSGKSRPPWHSYSYGAFQSDRRPT